jgi:hypothetical protein
LHIRLDDERVLTCTADQLGSLFQSIDPPGCQDNVSASVCNRARERHP